MATGLNELIKVFYANRNDAEAERMSAYMKYNFPFLGIKKPKRADLEKEFRKQFIRAEKIDWNIIFDLWGLPEREFQYLAVNLLISSGKKLQKADIKKTERLIITKSWWDTVDAIAVNTAGEICRKYPDLKEDVMLKWSKSDNMWIARTAILFQLKYKEKTDTRLLKKIIADNTGSSEFFINKAIGWILRQYSKTNPEWVKEYIRQNQLHPLSVREGSKYI